MSRQRWPGTDTTYQKEKTEAWGLSEYSRKFLEDKVLHTTEILESASRSGDSRKNCKEGIKNLVRRVIIFIKVH